MFSVLPKEYFSTAMEVLEYFQGSTAVLAKEYWKVRNLPQMMFVQKELLLSSCIRGCKLNCVSKE